MSRKLVLSFAKPKRAMPVDQWKSISADGAPPGVYTPNMSEDDQLRWKATVVGARSGNFQMEIRSTKPGANVLVVVNGPMPAVPLFAPFTRTQDNTAHEVKVSANGPMYFTPEVLAEFNAAIAEAREVLLLLDAKTTTHATYAAIKRGDHPLAEQAT